MVLRINKGEGEICSAVKDSKVREERVAPYTGGLDISSGNNVNHSIALRVKCTIYFL